MPGWLTGCQWGGSPDWQSQRGRVWDREHRWTRSAQDLPPGAGRRARNAAALGRFRCLGASRRGRRTGCGSREWMEGWENEACKVCQAATAGFLLFIIFWRGVATDGL